ncbi:hypothetical protein ACXR2T_10690 [Leucobacter sp. HY1910]
MTKNLIEEARRQVAHIVDKSKRERLISDLADALERSKRGGATLGQIIKRQGDDIVKITKSQDLIGDDGDGDWELVWERAFKMRADLDVLEARLPSEEDREVLVKIFEPVERLIYGADSLELGYEVADAVLAAGFSRAAVPDAATTDPRLTNGYQLGVNDIPALVAQIDRLESVAEDFRRRHAATATLLYSAEAERDAALAALERVRELWNEVAINDIGDSVTVVDWQRYESGFLVELLAALEGGVTNE